MNDSKKQTKSLYEEVPAMAAINQVPGFDPRKFLRMVVKENGEKAWKLDLGYMRAWFRMSRPNGRVRFKPLRITEQLAIFEAQVFLDRNDVEPFSNFTAQCTVEEAENGDYIKSAQDAALTVALTDAGFGIQFVDLIHDETGEPYGSEVPVSGRMKEKNVLAQAQIKGSLATAAAEHAAVKSNVTEEAAVKHATEEKQQRVSEISDKTATITNFPKKENQVEQLPVQKDSRPEELHPKQAADNHSGQAIEENQSSQVEERMGGQRLPVQSFAQTVEESLPVQASIQKAEESLPVQASAQATEESLPMQVSVQAKEESLPIQASVQTAEENLSVQASAQIAEESLPVQASTQATKEGLPVQASAQATEERLPVQTSVQSDNAGLPVQPNERATEERLPVSQNQVSYTADMPVEEILKQMTFEEAQNVVVDMGVCNGWTMAEVAERRAPSLKFYVYGGYRGNNNILRAAAKIILDSLTGQKAS